MVGIKHHRQVTEAESLDEAVEIDYSEWNEAHDKGNVADVLTDHTKAVHDALGLDHGNLSNVTASQHHAKYTDAEALAASIVKSLNPTWTDNYIMVYKSTPDEWQMEAQSGGGVSDHGDLTGLDDPADHTWAFLLDGSRAMTGNLDLASYALLTANLLIKELDSEYFALKNRADSAYKSLRMNRLRTESSIGIGTAPDTGVAGQRGFIKAFAPANDYHYMFYGKGSRASNTIYAMIANEATANVNNRAGFFWQVKDDGGSLKNAGNFQVSLSNISATNKSTLFEIEGYRDNSVVDFLSIDGGLANFPYGLKSSTDLAGSGNAYVYVDSGGQLHRGAAYP